MKLTKFTKILFATIAFSVLVHFVLRKNKERAMKQLKTLKTLKARTVPMKKPKLLVLKNRQKRMK